MASITSAGGPAGTGLSRRKFLSRSAGLALAVFGASKIPLSAFETGIAQAAQGERILVSVFFDGGIDALRPEEARALCDEARAVGDDLLAVELEARARSSTYR
jgi:hypothetical protein